MAGAIAFSPIAAAAQTAPPQAPTEATLSVAGEGMVERSPDLARVSLTIVTDDSDATRSAGKNTAILSALKAKLASLSLGPDAVRTTYFNVDYIPSPPKNLPPQERQPRYGYVTTRGLSVEVAPIESAGKIVDAATAAGVTTIGGVTFDLKDRKAAYREALAAALKDAQSSAAALATAGNLRVLRIVGIYAGAQPAPFQPFPGGARFSVKAAPTSAPPTEIAPNGPLDVSAHVDVTYEIRAEAH